jgi:hypothetical protein
MALPLIAKIKSMIPLDISTLSCNDKRMTCENKPVNENDKAELIPSRNTESTIFRQKDNKKIL